MTGQRPDPLGTTGDELREVGGADAVVREEGAHEQGRLRLDRAAARAAHREAVGAVRWTVEPDEVDNPSALAVLTAGDREALAFDLDHHVHRPARHPQHEKTPGEPGVFQS